MTHSIEPWEIQLADSGDSSVGMPATPTTILAIAPMKSNTWDWDEGVPIAYLDSDPGYRLPRGLWTESDHQQEAEGYGDFPAGWRPFGDGLDNAKRITACVNFCAGIDQEVLQVLIASHGTLKNMLAYYCNQLDF